MGRAKEAWMEQQELELMYEWISENISIDAADEDSDDFDEAVREYEAYCEKLQQQEYDEIVQAELEWYIYTQTHVGIYDTQISSVQELLNVEVNDEAQFSLLVMLHGHIVAAVESYLASTFIHKVTSSEELIRKLVETDPKFSKMKFTLKEIYEKHENMQLIVARYLKDLIFHDVAKVKPMFRDVLGCEFGDIAWLFHAVNVRHHCVHRAGIDKNSQRVDLSKESIKALIDNAAVLVESIESSVDSG